MQHIPYLLTVGGSDPSSGAGVQADIRLTEKAGLLPVSVVTSVIAQNFKKVYFQNCIKADMVSAQFRALLDQIRPVAIKVGLVGSAENAGVIARECQGLSCPLILDPVLASGSGKKLADAETVDAVKKLLIPLADLVTPNIPEAGSLSGVNITSKGHIVRAAKVLLGMGARAVYIKGGHLSGEKKCDYFSDGDSEFWLCQDDNGRQCHGTGCLFATGVACFLALKFSLDEAVILANALVAQSMQLSMSTGSDSQQRLILPEMAQNREVSTEEESEGVFPAAGSMPVIQTAVATAGEFPRLKDSHPGLYLVAGSAKELREAWSWGAKYGQLRIKNVSQNIRENEIRQAVSDAASFGCYLFINDFWKDAIRFGAYGVHLGSEDILSADLGEIRKSGLRLGISTHSIKEALQAAQLQPSYMSLGPVFPTTCKAMKFNAQGLSRINLWKRLFKNCPLIVIGGLTSGMKSVLVKKGADGFGVLSDIYHDRFPEKKAEIWLKMVHHEKNSLP